MSETKGTRRITVHSEVYLWRVVHQHREPAAGSSAKRICVESITAYHEHHPRAPLRIFFVAAPDGEPGTILMKGVVSVRERGSQAVNLHRPRTVAVLIRAALAAGWKPAQDRPLALEHGFRLLASLPNEAWAELTVDRPDVPPEQGGPSPAS